MPQNKKTSSAPQGLGNVVEEFITQYFEAHKGDLPAAGLYQRLLKEFERPLLEITLQQLQGNQKKAAEVLGINRNTLRKKIQDLGMNAKGF